jgi:hypothetical protein
VNDALAKVNAAIDTIQGNVPDRNPTKEMRLQRLNSTKSTLQFYIKQQQFDASAAEYARMAINQAARMSSNVVAGPPVPADSDAPMPRNPRPALGERQRSRQN